MDFLNKNSQGLIAGTTAVTVATLASKARSSRLDRRDDRQLTLIDKLHEGKISQRIYVKEQKKAGRSVDEIRDDIDKFHDFAPHNTKYNGQKFQPHEYSVLSEESIVSSETQSSQKQASVNLSEKNKNQKTFSDSHKLGQKTYQNYQNELGNNPPDSSDSNKLVGAKKNDGTLPFASASFSVSTKNNGGKTLKTSWSDNEVMECAKQNSIENEQNISPRAMTSKTVDRTMAYIVKQPGPPFVETSTGFIVIQFGTVIVGVLVYALSNKISAYIRRKLKPQQLELKNDSSSSIQSYLDIVVAYNKQQITKMQATNLLIHFYKMTKDKAFFILLGQDEEETIEPAQEFIID